MKLPKTDLFSPAAVDLLRTILESWLRGVMTTPDVSVVEQSVELRKKIAEAVDCMDTEVSVKLGENPGEVVVHFPAVVSVSVQWQQA